MKQSKTLVQGTPASAYAYPLGKAEGVVWTVDSGYPTLTMIAVIDEVKRYFRTASFHMLSVHLFCPSYIIIMWMMCKVCFNFSLTVLHPRKNLECLKILQTVTARSSLIFCFPGLVSYDWFVAVQTMEYFDTQVKIQQTLTILTWQQSKSNISHTLISVDQRFFVGRDAP